jgi:heme oxygenase
VGAFCARERLVSDRDDEEKDPMNEIMSRLKTETREEHKATERTEIGRAMFQGTMTLAEYKAQLTFYVALHAALEGRAKVLERAAKVACGPSKSARVQRDLAQLAAVDAPISPALALATERTCRHVDLASDAELLGMIYVLEGSAMGAAILYPRLKEALALPDEALSYYRGSGVAALDEWRAFGARMAEALLGVGEQEQALSGARAMFHHIRAVFEAIHPSTVATSTAATSPVATSTAAAAPPVAAAATDRA